VVVVIDNKIKKIKREGRGIEGIQEGRGRG
jgi:hypothetical protein